MLLLKEEQVVAVAGGLMQCECVVPSSFFWSFAVGSPSLTIEGEACLSGSCKIKDVVGASIAQDYRTSYYDVAYAYPSITSLGSCFTPGYPGLFFVI